MIEPPLVSNNPWVFVAIVLGVFLPAVVFTLLVELSGKK